MVYPLQDRYISLLTDVGFKRIFGTEPNKRLLIDFLNTLLPPHHHIQDLTFKNTENLGSTQLDRKAIFDIYCQAQNDDRFLESLKAQWGDREIEIVISEADETAYLMRNEANRQHLLKAVNDIEQRHNLVEVDLEAIL
jgi:hypothetical protein